MKRFYMHVKKTIAVLFCLFALSQFCLANNNLFLPGDAFFPTVMTKEEVTQFVDSPSTQRAIAYAAIGKLGASFCGYAGFQNARVPTADDNFAANLKKAYDRMRVQQPRILQEYQENGETKLIETNSMRVLFYPRDFDFQKFDLGVTYNENWIEQIERFGHKREHIQYSSLVDRSESVARSWRDGPRVLPLQAKIPEFKIGEKELTPVTIECPLQAIVLANGTLNDFFERDGEKTLRIYAVNSDAVDEWIYHEWEWKLVK